jgi:hypothetical protein
MKPKILILLQNFYGSRSMAGRRLRFPVYDVRIINRKNATYSRIVPHLEPHFDLYFGECTPEVGTSHEQKFPTDLEWVKKTLEHDDWFAVLAFSSQAHKACDDLEFVPFVKLPHPVSFKWRKSLILETVEKLLATEEYKQHGIQQEISSSSTGA